MFNKEKGLLNNLTFRSTANSSKLKSNYKRLDHFCYQDDCADQKVTLH